jgi:3-mercaptopyruvate sulfurtransferase SseA
MKRAKSVITKINDKTGRYEKLSIKAPKGTRKVGVDQNGAIIIYDDKGNVVAFRKEGNKKE